MTATSGIGLLLIRPAEEPTMADLFTHILGGYVIAVLLSWRADWITGPYVTLVMGAAILPDLSRIELVIPAATVEATLGVSWSWIPLHQVSGTFLVICLGTLLASKRLRRQVFLLLAIGSTSHYTLDFFLYNPSGRTGPLLWPFTDHRFAVNGFYLSSDRWPALVMMIVAATVWLLDRRRSRMNNEVSTNHSPTDDTPN
jgi:membrane-bound metal-dependent hydrolase YbcI (DUF457 family)